MAITYPIDVPLENITSFDVGEVNANVLRVSEFTGRGVVQEYEGDYWTATLRYRNLRRELAQPVLAFGSALRGPRGTFVLKFPGYSTPRGAAKDNPSSPTVDGGDQPGNLTLTIKSAPASISGWLLAGDIIQVGPSSRPHWHRVLADVDTDASGLAEIDVWPRVREGTANNDQVSHSSPLCLFRLSDKIETSIAPPVLHSVDFVCREAI